MAAHGRGLSAVVLSGGRGSRLGGVSKAALRVGGVALLDGVLDALAAAGVRDVVVVGDPPSPDRATRPGVRVTREDPPFAGPLAAVAAGLDLVPDGEHEVVLLACDLPRSPALLELLLENEAERSDPAAPGAGRAVVDAAGRTQWLAGRYAVGPLRAAIDAVRAERGTLEGASLRAALARLELERVPDRGGASLDVDTPEDLAAAGRCHDPSMDETSGTPDQPETTRRERRAGHAGTHRPWWHRSVVYQVYPRSFADSDGDGVGDLRGITSRLDHLAALGVDVLWLSPVYRSPQDDNGYDISDYTDVDPLFGDLAAMDELIAEAAKREIGIVMDLVVNHTSDEHAWFAESRSSRDNPKRDWYWWRPAREGFEPGTPGAEPTNWGSFFSGSTWQLDEATGEYYLHLFSRKQPDLDWENPEVRQAVYAMMRWWLERGVAGFRMDVINLISKHVGEHGELTDGAPRADGWGNGAPFYTDGPRMHEFLAEMHREVFDPFPGTYLTVGETPGVTLEEARLYTDPERREVDMVFQFEHMGLDHGVLGKFDPVPLHLPDLKANLARWQDGLATAGWNALYWNNHDQPRIVSRWGDDGEHRVASAKTLGTILHLHRGTPYVYQGEELGMRNAGFTALTQYRDLESLNVAGDAETMGMSTERLLAGLAYMSRDNARTPVAWDDSPNAGFTTGTPWLSLAPGWESINAAAERANSDSVFHHYRRLVALRRGAAAGQDGIDDGVAALVIDGAFALLAPEHERLWAFTRTLETEGGPREALLVVANLSGEPLEVDVAAELGDAVVLEGASVLVASHADAYGDAAVPDGGAHLALRPWESVVYRLAVRAA